MSTWFWVIFEWTGLIPTLVYFNLMGKQSTKQFRAVLKPFCKWFTAPATNISIFHDYMFDSGWSKVFGFILLSAYLYIWWRIWHDDVDDYWKKKRKKVAAKVKVIAGKLVVVPELVPIPTR